MILSIVTINKNNAAGLSRTISSLEQVMLEPQVECVFVDGASSDESITLAK